MVHCISTMIFLLIFLIINIFFNPKEFLQYYREQVLNSQYIASIIPMILLVAVSVIIKLWRTLDKDIYKDYILGEEKTEDFKETYTRLYKEHIEILETKRKKVKNKVALAYFLMIVFIFVYFIYNYTHDFKLDYTFWIWISVWLIYLIYNNKYEKEYKSLYKNTVINEFVKHLNPNLKFEKADINKAMSTYKSVSFGDRKFNVFNCDDYISGMIDNEIYLEMFDIHTQYQTSGKNKQIINLFQGIFSCTKCKKDINSEIRINKNELKITEGDRVKMDSIEFEKYFDIYSKNRILTMRILTSDTMEYLINFFEKYQLNFEIVFKRNKIYFRFFTGPMFEPEVFNSSMNEDLLYIYYKIFDFMIEVTKKVNNTLDNIQV